jgi:hypothetical protein
MATNAKKKTPFKKWVHWMDLPRDVATFLISEDLMHPGTLLPTPKALRLKWAKVTFQHDGYRTLWNKVRYVSFRRSIRKQAKKS